MKHVHRVNLLMEVTDFYLFIDLSYIYINYYIFVKKCKTFYFILLNDLKIINKLNIHYF